MKRIQTTIKQRGIDMTSVQIPSELLDEVDARLLGKFGFRTRTEIINEAIRAILLKYARLTPKVIDITKPSGVSVYVDRDGKEIQLNIVDENSSTLIGFSTDAEFEKFRKEIVNFKVGD